MAALVILLNGETVHKIDLDPNKEYLFGRSQACDVVLKDYPGISRQHLKLHFVHPFWVAELTSKLGTLEHKNERIESINLDHELIFSIPPYSFQFFQEEPSVSHQSVGIVPLDQESFQNKQEPISAEDLDQFTAIQTRAFQATLTLSSPQLSSSRSIRLEGTQWTVGRDKNCDLVVPDNRISRRQFEISKVNEEYYIKDLESSNGTNLNGTKIEPNELIRMSSGDTISTLDNVFSFEIKDLNFDSRVELPANQLIIPQSNQLAQSQQDFYSASNMGIEYPNVRHDSIAPYPSPRHRKTKKGAKDRVLTLVIVLIIGVIVYQIFNEPNPKKEIAKDSKDPFDRLSAKDQLIVMDTHALAKKLFTQGKFELAKSEIDKIHQLIASYKDSREIEGHCNRAIEIRQLQTQNLRAKEEQERLRIEMNEVLSKCKSMASSTRSLEEIESCLSLVLEKDPGNIEASHILETVEMNLEKIRLAEMNERNRQEQLIQSKREFQSAENLLEAQKYHEARSAFSKYIRSQIPDAGGYKARAKRHIASIDSLLENRISEGLSSAQSYFEKGQLKEAIIAADDVLKVDSNQKKALEIRSQSSSKLNIILKEFYEDSILQESIGNVDEAKTIWKKIKDLDLETGDYYNKAKKKLSLYGVK